MRASIVRSTLVAAMAMRRVSYALVVALLAAGMSPALVSAAPPPTSLVLTFDCSDGNSYDINFGAAPNNGSAGFVVGDNSVLVGKSFNVTLDDTVLVDWVRGLQGFDEDDLTTCTSSFGPFTFTLVGWLTPLG